MLLKDIKAYCNYFGLNGFGLVRLLFLRYFYVIVLIRLQSISNPLFIPVKFLSKVLLSMLFNIEVAGACKIGAGLILPHPQNIIIGAGSLGNNCIIMANVTIGASLPDPTFTLSLRPTIGANVLVGTGACVIGGITLGDNVKVGALTLVTKSVPDNGIVVGKNEMKG
jgi:serine acetyltransferase